jgi:hypothetical protein
MMICTLLLAGSLLSAVDSPPRVIVVVGAEGTPEFGAQFRNWADRWQTAVQQAGADCRVIGLTEITPETPDNFELKTATGPSTEKRPGSICVGPIFLPPNSPVGSNH